MNDRSDASTTTEDLQSGPLCLFFFSHPFGVLSATPPTVLCGANAASEASAASVVSAAKVASWARARLPPLATPCPLKSRSQRGSWAEVWNPILSTPDLRGPERLPPLEFTPAPRRRRKRRHHARRVPLARLAHRTVHVTGVTSVSCRESLVSARLSDALRSLRSAWLEPSPREIPSRHASAASGCGARGCRAPAMARRHSAPEADLRKFVVSQQRSDSEECAERASLLSGSWRELPTSASVGTPASMPARIPVSAQVSESLHIHIPNFNAAFSRPRPPVNIPIYNHVPIRIPAPARLTLPARTLDSSCEHIPPFVPEPTLESAFPHDTLSIQDSTTPSSAPSLLEVMVSQEFRNPYRPQPPRHRPSLTTNIDEYVSEILVESLHSLGDRLESVSDALGANISVIEKEIKVRFQNTGVNTVVHLSPTSNHQIIFGNKELCLQETEVEQKRAATLHRLNSLFGEDVTCESPLTCEERADSLASPPISLVDSLEEPVPAAPFPEILASPPLPNTAMQPMHDSILDPKPTHIDSEAFFIRIDDGGCEPDEDKVVVADHMPEKIRKRLIRRQKRREMRIERARRLRSKSEREKCTLQAAAGQEVRRECAAVLRALIEAVSMAEAEAKAKAALVEEEAERSSDSPSPPGRRRSRIPVRVVERQERRWSHVFAAIPEEHIPPESPESPENPTPSIHHTAPAASVATACPTSGSPEREVKTQRTIATQANVSSSRPRRSKKPLGATPSSSERASASSSAAPPPSRPRTRRTTSPGGWSLRLAGGRSPLDLQLRLRLQPQKNCPRSNSSRPSCPNCPTCGHCVPSTPSLCSHRRNTPLTEDTRNGVIAICGDLSGSDTAGRRRRVAACGRRALSVRGRGISPELKPRAPSQTERDLTRNRTRRNTLF